MALRSEARHDNMTPRPHDTFRLRHIAGAIPMVGEEVKHCAVVPDIMGCGWEWRAEYVGNVPPGLGSAFAQPFLRTGESRWCPVEDTDVSVTGAEQTINQCRGPTSHV
jgi:hypothetical protein